MRCFGVDCYGVSLVGVFDLGFFFRFIGGGVRRGEGDGGVTTFL